MNHTFSYPELQQKFCEGFEFFPFRNLEQYGKFIYKRYANVQDLQGVLDCYDFENNLYGLSARVLLLMMQQKNIPAAAALLTQLKEVSAFFTRQCHGMHLLFYAEMIDALETYNGILFIYQRDVQQNIEKQLCDPGRFEQETAVVSIGTIKHIQVVITEFADSTDIMNDFLNERIAPDIGNAGFELPKTEAAIITDLSRKLLEFKDLMRKTGYIMKQWETRLAQLQLQEVMN
ncbi:hypothetical protein SAMN04488505_102183 [Chitinophaga rupis]|uniref:Uncharacterized protein n=1 Tax=Chitinophaga rupis TaxID=573321 RepID=A0A1H7PX12_9BACT|nr:hypothetical protein [Chitinophaga rupis]SEL39795.1 hypothetical protein SAMN04488505_102183 [Chitinophaga rupis]